MRKHLFLHFTFLACFMVGCAKLPTTTTATRKPTVTEYPPLNWSLNSQRLTQTGCQGKLTESCAELMALGCEEVNSPNFYAGGLDPPYAVMECLHTEEGESPDPTFFRQVNGLDRRFRTFAVLVDGKYRLMIKRSEFKALFSPVESTDEAISYAMAMTSLQARFDLKSDAEVEYLVDAIAETHAEETAEGYMVTLFDWSHQMGCDTHPFYDVLVLVTNTGEVREVLRREIYRGDACFDFDSIHLEGD